MEEILCVLQEMSRTDRVFFGTYRFMNSQHRDTIMATHLRNNANAIALLRHYLLVANAPIEPPTSLVMSIPLNLDISGNFFDPIPVHPTVEQIRTATEREIPVINETCAICQDSVTVATRIRSCGHCFHAECINEWFSQSPRCPVCRHDVREPVAEPHDASPVYEVPPAGDTE